MLINHLLLDGSVLDKGRYAAEWQTQNMDYAQVVEDSSVLKLGNVQKFNTGGYNGIYSADSGAWTRLQGKSFTISCWLRIDNWNAQYETYWSYSTTSVAWPHLTAALLRNSSSNNLCFTISNGSSYTSTGLSFEVNVGEWMNIVCRYTLGQKIDVFINGVLKGTLNTTIIPAFSAVQKVTIGNARGSSYQTNSSMKDWRVYDKALSELEIKDLTTLLNLKYNNYINTDEYVKDQSIFHRSSAMSYHGIIPIKDFNDGYGYGFAHFPEGLYWRDSTNMLVGHVVDSTFRLTMESWIQLYSEQNYNDDLFFGSHTSNNRCFLAFYQNNPGIGYGNNSNGSTVNINLKDGKWHHYVGVFEGLTARMYIDGELVQTKSSTVNFTIQNPIFVGSVLLNGTDTNYGTNCNLALNKIYYSALTTDEVKARFQNKFYISDDACIYATSLYETSTVSRLPFVWLPLRNNAQNVRLGGSKFDMIGDSVEPTYNGNGADFNNSTQALVSSDNWDQVFTNDSEWSIGFWLVSRESGTRGIIFGNYQNDGLNFNVEITTTNKLRMYWNENPDWTVNCEVNNDGLWHHYVITHRKNSTKVYKDGAFVQESTATLNGSNISKGPYRLGRDTRNSTVTWYNGKMRDFMIDNVAWTADQVIEIYDFTLHNRNVCTMGVHKGGTLIASTFIEDDTVDKVTFKKDGTVICREFVEV